jgi:hypothetical protein
VLSFGIDLSIAEKSVGMVSVIVPQGERAKACGSYAGALPLVRINLVIDAIAM